MKIRLSTFVKSVITLSLLIFFVSSIANAGSEITKVFNNKCAKCHGTSGKVTKRGKKLGAKNFANLEWQQSISDEKMIEAISNGKKKMPSWKDKLSKAEIEGLVHHIRVLLPHGKRAKMPHEIKKKHYGK